MKRGYVALYRKIQDHEFYKEKREFSKYEAWVDILMEAQHKVKDREVVIGMKVLFCKYGESLKSIKTWSLRWGWSESKVRRFLKLLKNMQQIDVKGEGKTTRISVLNYSSYDPKRRDNDEQVKNKRRERDENATTDNNDKNGNNVKNVKKYTHEIENFARTYQEYVSNAFGKLAPKITDSFISKCSKTITQLIEIDKFTFKEIFDSMQWASNDPFWRTQLKSLANIRTNGKNGEKKFINMFTAYKSKDVQALNPAEKRLQSNIEVSKGWINGQ